MAAWACANVLVAVSACAAVGVRVGTGASVLERLTSSLSDSGTGAPSPSGALRFLSDLAGGGLPCGGILDECALVLLGIEGKGDLQCPREDRALRVGVHASAPRPPPPTLLAIW